MPPEGSSPILQAPQPHCGSPQTASSPAERSGQWPRRSSLLQQEGTVSTQIRVACRFLRRSCLLNRAHNRHTACADYGYASQPAHAVCRLRVRVVAGTRRVPGRVRGQPRQPRYFIPLDIYCPRADRFYFPPPWLIATASPQTLTGMLPKAVQLDYPPQDRSLPFDKPMRDEASDGRLPCYPPSAITWKRTP